ncbi:MULTISPECIES: hypothetical protein [Sinorhizobium]|uniref:hypothetical protein n=1 Tax=Sinorhizobium TaxID=28105 RepID=UPI0004B4962B|nr:MULTISPECIES: hypothetical protein [Sinorhizobium]ASY55445.1 hypothetical protein SS05631_c04900 [Sinorhizobium sp. CCBAU 05631]PDT52147.1 hypothetical protein CO664_14985 [Sinorhizobium sp. NG07B]POH27879.1 hypothetical protein ATY30_19525 [Sinorhizobium americanum]
MLTVMTPGAAAIKPLNPETHGAWTRVLAKAGYMIDPWRCDVDSGAFVVGLQTLSLLGLRQNPCGIIDLVRAYDPKDRATILSILEKATATSSSFCFSAMVRRPGGSSRQLCCIGNSTIGEAAGGSLQGVFAVPRNGAALPA